MADEEERTPKRSDVDRLGKAQREAVNRARRELKRTFETVYNMYDDPADIRDALLDLVPAIARKYGNVGGVAAAEWYDRMRAKWLNDDGYTADSTYDPDDIPMRRTVRRLAGHLWDSEDEPADPDLMLRGLYANMDRWVKAGGRETIERATRRDPSRPRYARVPSGAKTCAFCAMLASRGFVYATEDKAGALGQYHKDCDCEIIPSWDKHNPRIEGYDSDKLYREYLEARDSVESESPTLKEILTAMKSHPGRYSDSLSPGKAGNSGGPATPTPSHPMTSSSSWPHDPNEGRILALRNETNVTDSQWERRQIAAGGPSPDIEKMYPQEIVFLERAKAHGESIEWIPTGKDGMPRNDFKWLSHENTLTELKSPAGTKYKNVAKRISDAVAVAKKHGVVKDVFVIDFGGMRIPEKLLTRLAKYNETHADAIKELWVWDDQGLRQIM